MNDFHKNFTFETGNSQWLGDFADYPPEEEAFYELAWGWENLPAERTPSLFKKGIYLAGNNHSDDLFMYVKVPVTGLKANTKYLATMIVDLATDIPVGSMGSGGSEGESVYFKIGAATKEPSKLLQADRYVLNVDKGDQKTSGKNAVVVGNLANPLVDPDHRQFALKQLDNIAMPIEVTSDEMGQCWIFVGTDSGYEGITKYYIGKIDVTLHEKGIGGYFYVK